MVAVARVPMQQWQTDEWEDKMQVQVKQQFAASNS